MREGEIRALGEIAGRSLARPTSVARDHRSAAGEGRRRRVQFAAERASHVGRIDHLRLLNHPAVYERIHGWLAQDLLRRSLQPAPGAPV